MCMKRYSTVTERLAGTVKRRAPVLLCGQPMILAVVCGQPMILAVHCSSILGSDYFTSYATVVRYHNSFATRSSVIRTRLKETASDSR